MDFATVSRCRCRHRGRPNGTRGPLTILWRQSWGRLFIRVVAILAVDIGFLPMRRRDGRYAVSLTIGGKRRIQLRVRAKAIEAVGFSQVSFRFLVVLLVVLLVLLRLVL